MASKVFALSHFQYFVKTGVIIIPSLAEFSQVFCGIEPLEPLVICVFVPTLGPPQPSHINHYIVSYQGKQQATSSLPALI